MHRLRSFLTALAAAAIILGSMGVAAASGTSSANESRADFIEQLDMQLGISPVYPVTPDYHDVPASSSYYGYIEAATQRGFVNGVTIGYFKPNDPITRAEAAKILVEAYGAGSEATATSTAFSDNAKIPSALVGFVAEAAQLGLLKGFPDGSFHPQTYLTSAQERHLISQLQAALAANGLKITASSTDVAVGQRVTLTATNNGSPASASFAVTSSNASGAVVSGSAFIASAPGNYVVQGTVGSATASVTIGVYGAAAGLKISVPDSVVANGVSSETVSVAVVDANGIVVASNSDPISLTQSGQAFTASGFDGFETAANGVATFTETAGTVGGAQSTLNATDAAGSTTLNAPSVTVTAAPQTATSLSVTASGPDITANTSSSQNGLVVEAFDQTGHAMLNGTFGYTLTLTGPATFDGASQKTVSGVFSNSGSTNPSPLPVSIWSVQGQTGTVTATATSSGLKPGSTSISAVISGSATGITASSSATSFAATDTNLADPSASGDYVTISTQLVDAHANPVGTPSQLTVQVTMGGSPSENLGISTDGGLTWSYLANGTLTFSPPHDGSFEIANFGTPSGSGADAGTYRVTVSDNSSADNLSSPSATALTLTETPGPVAQVLLTPSGDPIGNTIKLPTSSPTATFTAQLADFFGNPVAKSGVAVDFHGQYFGASGEPYTLGTSASATTASGAVSVGDATYAATTGGGGSATATFTAHPVSGDTYLLWATAAGAAQNDVEASIVDTVAKTVSVSTANGSTTTNYFNAGDTVTVNASVTDQNGTGVTGDVVTFTFPDGTTDTQTTVNGQATDSFTARRAGSAVVTVQDDSTLQQPQGSASISVAAGSQAGWGFYNNAGQLVGFGPLAGMSIDASVSDAASVAVAAGTPAELTIKPIDAYGNAVVYAGASQSIALVAPTGTGAGASGSFRATQSGSTISSLAILDGHASVSVWYVNSVAQTGLNFDNAAQ